MSKYTYNGIEFTNAYFKIKEYKVFYEYYYKNNLFYIYLINYEDDRQTYGVINQSLSMGKAILKEKLLEDYKKNLFPTLIKDNYKLYPLIEPILKESRTNGIAYHITATSNIESIFNYGLIPSKNTDIEVINANTVIDSIKNKHNISTNFHRKECVFFHPFIDNEFLTYKDYYKNCTLIAVNISNETGYVASSGLGGLCMYDEDYNYNMKNIKKYANLYWKHSVKLSDYLKKDFNTKSPYDFSEIIINKTFIPKELNIIGQWNENGDFVLSNLFNDFLKDKYKDNFNQILEKY